MAMPLTLASSEGVEVNGRWSGVVDSVVCVAFSGAITVRMSFDNSGVCSVAAWRVGAFVDLGYSDAESVGQSFRGKTRLVDDLAADHVKAGGERESIGIEINIVGGSAHEVAYRIMGEK